jgi:hypothetical protein
MTLDPTNLTRCVDAALELVADWPKLKRLALALFLRTLAERIERLP